MQTAAETYQNASRQQQRDALVLNHLALVRHVLGKLAAQLPEGLDLENLESAGVLGLVEAAQQYDPTRGVPFDNFAYRRVHGAMIDELRRNCPLPQQMLRQIAQIREACEQLEPPITPEQLAQHTRLTLAQVDASLAAMRLTRTESWAETRLPPAQDPPSQDRPDAAAEARETIQLLADCIEALPEQERLVVTLYYLEDLRLKEIGQVLNLSESRVSRVLARAEFRLKESMRLRGGS